jgi:DHA1 family bicyclomycin/chloramphenicol resistance-like MFS transporter
VALVSGLIATAALSIDLVLPSFSGIREAYDLSSDANSVTWVVTAFFIGMAIGQPLYGPVTDRYGRRATLYFGLTVHAGAAVASALAPSLGFMIVARLIWGVGSAGIRVTATAMVRDRYQGPEMARAMSFIMSVFMIAPVLAPTFGAIIVDVGSWRWTFATGAFVAVGVGLWALRVPETLRPDQRTDLQFKPVLRAARTVVTTPQTLGYTMAQAFIMGGFISFIASSEYIFGELYDQADRFPQLFALVASTMAVGTLTNARLARRVPLPTLARRAMFGFVAAAAVAAVLAGVGDGRPPLWQFVVSILLVGGAQAFLMPNLAALAMEPVGRIAGMASAITGTIFTGGGALLGSLIDRRIDTTVTPLVVGFSVYGLIALGVLLWTERLTASHGQQSRPEPAQP